MKIKNYYSNLSKIPNKVGMCESLRRLLQRNRKVLVDNFKFRKFRQFLLGLISLISLSYVRLAMFK